MVHIPKGIWVHMWKYMYIYIPRRFQWLWHCYTVKVSRLYDLAPQFIGATTATWCECCWNQPKQYQTVLRGFYPSLLIPVLLFICRGHGSDWPSPKFRRYCHRFTGKRLETWQVSSGLMFSFCHWGCKSGGPIKTASSPDSPAAQDHDQSISSSIRPISLHLIVLQHSQPLPSSCSRRRNEVQSVLFDTLLIFHANICAWSSSSNRKH